MRTTAFALTLTALIAAGGWAAPTKERGPEIFTELFALRGLEASPTNEAANRPQGGNLANPFTSGTPVQRGNARNMDEFYRMFPPQPLPNPADGTWYFTPSEFQFVWRNADAVDRRTDLQSGRRWVYHLGRWIYENTSRSSTASTTSTTGTTSTHGATSAGEPETTLPPERFEIPWDVAQQTAPGPISVHELRPSTTPHNLPSWTSQHGQPNAPVSITRRTCRAGESLSLEVYAEFNCEVYIVGPPPPAPPNQTQPEPVLVAGQDIATAYEGRGYCRLDNVVLPRDGEYLIVVGNSPLSRSEGGQFTLSIGSTPPTR